MRIVPDMAVNGTAGSNGLVDGLLGVMLRGQNNGQKSAEKTETKLRISSRGARRKRRAPSFLGLSAKTDGERIFQRDDADKKLLEKISILLHQFVRNIDRHRRQLHP